MLPLHTTVTALGKVPTHVSTRCARSTSQRRNAITSPTAALWVPPRAREPEPVRHPLGECLDLEHSRDHALRCAVSPRSVLIRHGLLDPSTIDGLRQALTCSSRPAPLAAGDLAPVFAQANPAAMVTKTLFLDGSRVPLGHPRTGGLL